MGLNSWILDIPPPARYCSSMSKKELFKSWDWKLVSAVVFFLSTRAALIFVYDHYWSDTPIYRDAAACLLTTLASQRVFSPQYVVWLLPMAATLPFARRGFDWKVAFPLCGIVFLTFLEFDRGNYEGLRRFETASVISVAARNALCVSAAAFFALRLFKWKANLPIDEVEHSKKESI